MYMYDSTRRGGGHVYPYVCNIDYVPCTYKLMSRYCRLNSLCTVHYLMSFNLHTLTVWNFHDIMYTYNTYIYLALSMLKLLIFLEEEYNIYA